MKEELLKKISEILEVDQIVLDDLLEKFEEWDSLTALSIIAMADSDYNKTLNNEDMKTFKTVNDLVNFILQ
jgi:acyl carrier protein